MAPIRIVKEIMISASPEVIWNIMVKHLEYPEIEREHGPEWKKLAIKDVKGESLTSKRSGAGVKTRWHYTFFGLQFVWDDEVIEWEEMKRIVYKSTSTWNMIDSFTLTPRNSESRLVNKMDYTPPYGILGRIYYSLIVNRHLERNLEYTLRQMKRSAEKLAKLKLRKAK